MAFDQATRNRLQRFVSDARDLLAAEFTRQAQNEYGLDPVTGKIASLETLTHLDDTRRETAGILRDTLAHYLATSPSSSAKEALERIVREQAFTVLNRMAALRMAEARGILIESVSAGYQSQGFQLYERLAGAGLGETGDAYRCYLFSLFDEFALDLKVLFDRFSPQGRLFPREGAFLDLLKLLNDPELAHLWAEDETIGWIYQYFNSKEERKKMRDESAAPRNSRELAVRNQFFTPRYVVEFLTDNTLGRIWYEMTQGATSLAHSCRYLVKRPSEVFIVDKHPSSEAAKKWLMGQIDETPSTEELAYTVDAYIRRGHTGTASVWLLEKLAHYSRETKDEYSIQDLLDILFLLHRGDRFSPGLLDNNESIINEIVDQLKCLRNDKESDELSQGELLRQTIYIPHRPLKDPRELRMLDPACGSMHFGLYSFDLYERIYEEAWEIEVEKSKHHFERGDHLKPLTESYPDKEEFLRDVPRLIIEHNIHGIDIDPRAVQIAGLSLWLRAQRSWHNQGVKPAARPRITRSNIVCAEPMPGEKELLREFTARLEVPALGYLVEQVFDKMQLAGEAGSLLKIEEEIRDIIAEAKKLWKAGPKLTQMGLFAESTVTPEQFELPLDFAGITDEQFWEGTEEKVYKALQEYSEVAGDRGYQRRLFAGDAARGFAFVDLCRKRYDAVVMNPPFGEFTEQIKNMVKKHYARASQDILAAMVARGLTLCIPMGFVGAITSRACMFQSTFSNWREKYLLGDARMTIIADLGSGVMDDAAVDASAYTISRSDGPSTYLAVRALVNDPVLAIESGIASASRGVLEPFVFMQTHNGTGILPGSPITYWCSNHLLRKLSRTAPLSASALLEMGMSTKNDERWVRTWWEVPSEEIGWSKSYRRYAKGSDSGSNFGFVYCIVRAANNFFELHTELIQKYPYLNGSSDWIIHPEYHYGAAGLTYGRRVRRFIPVPLPQGIVFSENNPAIFPKDTDCREALSIILASRISQCLLAFIAPPRILDVGYVSKIPVPIPDDDAQSQFSQLFRLATSQGIQYARRFETSPYFIKTQSGSSDNISYEQTIEGAISAVDQVVSTLLSLDPISASNLLAEFSAATGLVEKGAYDGEPEVDPRDPSYYLGTAFGRWDIRYSTDDHPLPELPDPFDPLPTCPTGMLQNSVGLPAEPKDVPIDYPLRISWHGILVDEEGHKEDIVGRVRDAIEAIWQENAGNIEHEACEILSFRSLRDYFVKPSGFFADHLKRYSKSRRQAPIYWPLSTPSGSYTLWLYYHRLNDQTLYTCVNDFIEPKLADVAAELASLRQKGSGRSREDEKRLEKLQDLDVELQEFRDELLRLAKLPWKPNLNDGVQITAAPLWKLFQLPKWKKTLKETWEKLEKGDYDWAHLAYSIWPDRVRKKCVTDKSLAIAHDLEDLYIEPPASAKKKRGK